MSPPRIDMEQRFWSRVRKSDGCWIWTGGTQRDRRYGRISIPGRGGGSISAHRYSAMLHFGMFDRRLLVLHRCDTPLCVRPDHLYLGTDADNMRDRDERGRQSNGRERLTHCLRGHEFTPENTIQRDGRRGCRTCKVESDRQRWLRRKGSTS